MDSWFVKAGLAGAVLVLVLSAILVPRMKAANPTNADILTQVLGGTADLAANQAYREADVYFHAGTGRKVSQPETGEHEPLSLPLAGWIEKMHSSAAPQVHKHLDGAESGEMLPWFVMAVRLNPHHIEAYSTGVYWFYRSGETRQAEDFISEGISRNPKDYRLYLDRGILHYHERNWDRSVTDLETALKLWKNLNEDSPYDLKAIRHYLTYARAHKPVPGS